MAALIFLSHQPNNPCLHATVFTEYSALMDDRESGLDQTGTEEDSFLEETTTDGSDSMSQTTSGGRGRTADVSEWETADDDDDEDYGEGFEPPRKKRFEAMMEFYETWIHL